MTASEVFPEENESKIIRKKVWKEYFDKIILGIKTVELRLDDFDIQPGDTLILEEWNPKKMSYTGRTLETTATYILKTKKCKFWSKEEIERYGFQIIQFEPKTTRNQGSVVIFVNQREEVLLQLRDDNPNIPYPNHWGLPGGGLHPGESPKQGAIREIKEEIEEELDPQALHFLSEIQHKTDGTTYTFWYELDKKASSIPLHEGQKLAWFTEKKIKKTKMAYDNNVMMEIFFHIRPYIT